MSTSLRSVLDSLSRSVQTLFFSLGRVVRALVYAVVFGTLFDVGLRLLETFTVVGVLAGLLILIPASVCFFALLVAWCDNYSRSASDSLKSPYPHWSEVSTPRSHP